MTRAGFVMCGGLSTRMGTDKALLPFHGRTLLEQVAAQVRAGVTTDELDELAHDTYVAHGAYPSTLHYQGFPKSICTSVNEVVCHGIGDDRPLREGDIVNLDVTAYLDGMHGDRKTMIAPMLTITRTWRGMRTFIASRATSPTPGTGTGTPGVRLRRTASTPSGKT